MSGKVRKNISCLHNLVEFWKLKYRFIKEKYDLHVEHHSYGQHFDQKGQYERALNLACLEAFCDRNLLLNHFYYQAESLVIYLLGD